MTRSFVEVEISPTLLRRMANMLGGSGGQTWRRDPSRDAEAAVALLRIVYAAVYRFLEGISKGRGASLLDDLRDLQIQLGPATGRSSLVMDTEYQAMYALSQLASQEPKEASSNCA